MVRIKNTENTHKHFLMELEEKYGTKQVIMNFDPYDRTEIMNKPINVYNVLIITKSHVGLSYYNKTTDFYFLSKEDVKKYRTDENEEGYWIDPKHCTDLRELKLKRIIEE